MRLLILPLLLLTGCATSNRQYSNAAMQEDSIAWEYDKQSLSYPDTRNSNNTMLDSPDGSTYKGRGFNLKKTF